MSSACVVLQPPSPGAARWSQPPSPGAARWSQPPSPGAARWSQPPAASSRSDSTSSSQTSLWRPWLSSRGGHEGCPHALSSPDSKPSVPGSLSSDGKAEVFQHPVRLFWSRSRSFDYLYSDGEVLLRNFPVQATISFYSESNSEDEEEEEEEDWEEDGDSEECLKQTACFTSYN